MADNDQEFANSIIDSTLQTIRDQDDQTGQTTLVGDLSVNPQSFQPSDQQLLATFNVTSRQFWSDPNQAPLDKRLMVVGPISFEVKFLSLPKMGFSESPTPPTLQTTVGMQANEDAPFLTHMFVKDWVWVNGVVDGFYLGLYAITTPVQGVVKHTISWTAVGIASRYSTEAASEAWTEPYDDNDTSFLTDDYNDNDPDYTDDLSDY